MILTDPKFAARPVRNNGQQTVGQLNQAAMLGHKGEAVRPHTRRRPRVPPTTIITV